MNKITQLLQAIWKRSKPLLEKVWALLNRTAKRLIEQARRKLKKTFSTKRNRRRGIYAGGLFIITLLIFLLLSSHASSQHQQHLLEDRLNDRTKKLIELNNALQTVKKQKADTDSQLKQKAQQQQDLENQIKDLNDKLQAKLNGQDLAQRVASAVVPKASAASLEGCGDNFYANFIYSHESGCKLINPNGSGCDGIGQACPSSKIYAACPNMDYACQNAWFTNYANKYGGWAGAYQFWLNNHWW